MHIIQRDRVVQLKFRGASKALGSDDGPDQLASLWTQMEREILAKAEAQAPIQVSCPKSATK